MTNPELRGDSFLIVGFGREGRSILKFLLERCPGARIGIADRKGAALEPGLAEEICVHSGREYLSAAASYDTVIRSPGVSIREIAPHLSAASHVTSATSIFFAECPGVTIGVTGTKGKSTTSSLTASMLSEVFPDVRLVGNIGTPMLDHLCGASPETRFVVELSSYQLEDLRRSPTVAILLNIVPEHLDYHGGFESYCEAKLSIARNQGSADLLVMNESNELLKRLTAGCAGVKRYFSDASSSLALVSVRDGVIGVNAERGFEPIVSANSLPVLGPGNLQNVLAAVTCAVSLGASPEEVRRGLASFKPLEHRLEYVATRDGVSFYNDSLSTIPEALANALQALGARVETVIAGGFDRGVDMAPVGPALAASGVKNLILFPTTGEKIWQSAVSAAPDRAYVRVDVQSMDEAVQAAYDLTSAEKICVMSPASTSFSVFVDYRDRGEQFKSAVRRLGKRT